MNNLGDHFNCQRRFAPTLFTWLERSIHLVGIRTIIDRAKLGRTPLSSHQSETYRYPISKSGSMATSSARDADAFGQGCLRIPPWLRARTGLALQPPGTNHQPGACGRALQQAPRVL